jgi:pimeloyl-ACP methyl ester carboxylesterase
MRSTRLAASLILAATVLGGCALVTDRRASAREAAAEAAFPPMGQFVTVEGRRIHAHVEGDGPDLVLIHGASGNARDFTFALVDALKDRYRVVAFDRPGMGWSDDAGPDAISPTVQAAILQAAARNLGVTRPVVLGHSYGGAVAMGWGLTATPDTAALVIVAGATMPWPGGLGLLYEVNKTRLGGAVVIPAITAFAPRVAVDGVLASVFAPDPVPAGYAEHFGPELSLRRASLAANARQVGFLKPHIERMAARYPELHLPVEIVHGTADTIVPARIHAERLVQVLPDARLTLIDGAAHMPHHSHMDQVIAAIDRAALRAGLR